MAAGAEGGFALNNLRLSELVRLSELMYWTLKESEVPGAYTGSLAKRSVGEF